MSDPKYFDAEEFLNLMLNKNSFDSENATNVVKRLFSQLGPFAVDSIKEALNEHIYPKYIGEAGSPRLVVNDVNQDIANSRKDVQTNKHFLDAQNALLSGKLPEKKDMDYFFDGYADDAIDTIKRFQSPEFVRLCGVPMLAHWMRVGAVVRELNGVEEDGFRRSYAAFKHDDVETGVPIVGLEKYFDYLREHIPVEILDEVVLLTNHYDIYLNYVRDDFKAKNLDPTKNMVLNSLKKLRKINKGELYYADKIINFVREAPDVAKSNGSVIDEMKGFFYENFYLPEMAKFASEKEKLYILEDKIVDLLDNDNGSKKIPLKKYIKNISKQWGMVKVAESLKSDYVPFNNKVKELKNNALTKARYLIIDDLLEKDMSLDFLYSTTGQILSKLKHVLYE